MRPLAAASCNRCSPSIASSPLAVLELRAKAQKALGSKFDLRAFHDEVLDSGALPLDVLEKRVDAWIASQKAGAQ